MASAPFHAVIVDDENNSCDIIRLMLQQYSPDIQIVATADSCRQGIMAIQRYHPQLVFLDLELRDGTGVDVLKKVQDENFEAIFVTAYEKKFLSAIRFSNLQIILKPPDKNSLIKSVQKAKENLLQKKGRKRYNILLENMDASKNNYKILLHLAQGYEEVLLQNIRWLQQLDGATAVYLQDGNCVNTERHFHYYGELLQEFNFFQITNQVMINLTHLEKINAARQLILLDDGTQLAASSRRCRELAEKINAW